MLTVILSLQTTHQVDLELDEAYRASEHTHDAADGNLSTTASTGRDELNVADDVSAQATSVAVTDDEATGDIRMHAPARTGRSDGVDVSVFQTGETITVLKQYETMSVSFVQSSLNSTVCHLYRVEPVNVLFRLVGRSLIDIKAKFDCVVFLETIGWQRSVKREGHICYRTYIFMCVFFWSEASNGDVN